MNLQSNKFDNNSLVLKFLQDLSYQIVERDIYANNSYISPNLAVYPNNSDMNKLSEIALLGGDE